MDDIVALSIEPSGEWVGNDGRWSTFSVSVGSPNQGFEVLVSMETKALIVPDAEGCTRMAFEGCGALRGVQLFDQRDSRGFQLNRSTTWHPIGLYELGEQRGEYNVSAFFGYETISIYGNPALGDLSERLVASVALPGIWTGAIGVAPGALKASETEVVQSLVNALKDAGKIPSLSFGYTSGAAHRQCVPFRASVDADIALGYTGVPGSLTLGGFDRSRMLPDNITLPISAQDHAPYTVGLQSILASNSLRGPVSLSNPSGGIAVSIDSTISELWLPQEMCDEFETAFGLQYDSNSDRYRLNNTERSRLREMGIELSFRVGSRLIGGDTLSISIPLAALDLEATYPIFPNATRYMPIRRAANETQYALGRVFLQESYIFADWERGNFTVAAAAFTSPMPSVDLVTVWSTDRPGTTSGEGLSNGAIAGAVVGSTIALVFIIILALKVCAARKTSRTKQASLSVLNEQYLCREERNLTAVAELGATIVELPGSSTVELSAPHGSSELLETKSR